MHIYVYCAYITSKFACWYCRRLRRRVNAAPSTTITHAVSVHTGPVGSWLADAQSHFGAVSRADTGNFIFETFSEFPYI